jgi:hypothetical protein
MLRAAAIRLYSYAFNVFVGIDITLNALIGGGVGETFSYRAFKWQEKNIWAGCVICKLLNKIHRRHCERSAAWYRSGARSK